MDSPATPNQANKVVCNNCSAKVAVPLINAHASSACTKQSSLHEPSPASTYGDTAVGDSSPMTPQEVKHRKEIDIIKELAAAQLDDTTDFTREFSRHTGSSKSHTESETGATACHTGHVDPYSPSQAGGAGRYRNVNPSNNSSPSAQRLATHMESPWRRRGFVQPPSHDPFVSRGQAGQSPPANNLRPRADRAGQILTGDNAQALLPPSACVFVANLCQTKADDQLEYSVSQVFSQFGNVYVKIRRDGNGMPFAFCQYENVADSERAIQHGRGLVINGRSVRTERAKVNRSLYLSRITGGRITEEEARQVLSPFGDIEKVWYCTSTDREIFNLAEGIWVMFAFFQDSRDAQSTFRDNQSYRLEHPPLPDEFKGRIKRSFQSPIGRSSQGHQYTPPSAFAGRSTDRCSIFVGNLPPKVTQEELIEMFGGCGRIRGVEIVSKPSVNVNGVNVFAFVEFSNEEEAVIAVKGEQRFLAGLRLRVERKESSVPSPRRGSPRASGSPVNRGGQPDHNAAVYYHRALASGVSPMQANQIFNLNASQTIAPPAMAPPVYSGYNFYHPYYQAQYASYPAMDGGAPGNTHDNPSMHGSSQMGHFQYAQAATPYVAPYSHYQQPNPYVYPPVSAESSDATPAIAGNEAQ